MNDSQINPKIGQSWIKVLGGEFSAPYIKELKKKLVGEMKQGIVLYPSWENIFNAFNLTPFDKVKVVILGQDPYHEQGQAHGLSFSVPEGVKSPPSLVNIFKEMENDLSVRMFEGGSLEGWARQGVLLLNTILTVRAGIPASHRNIGWEKLTDATIKALSDKKENVVFILWGKFAQEKERLIDSGKHLILKAPHPSPYSANSGFFGCKHFSRVNEYLKRTGQTKIDWTKTLAFKNRCGII